MASIPLALRIGMSLLPALALTAAPVVAGCTTDSPVPADSGGGVDAGRLDSGPAIDSGPGIDGGPGADAGPGTDVGSGSDAGPGTDTGPAVCGDGVIAGTEQCDDGNTMAGDGCGATCRREVSPSCGDGTLDRATSEECDDGNTMAGDGCSATCAIEAPPACGDGALDLSSGEECDDGNAMTGDGCGPTCQLESLGAACGDSAIAPMEVCDDGNTAGGDGCNPTCNFTGTTSAFAGAPYVGAPVRTDGVGAAARFAASGTLAADATYLWMAEPPGPAPSTLGFELRRIEIATATVLTVATLAGAEGIATNGTDTVWVAGGQTIERVDVSGAPPYTATVLHNGGGCMAASCYADGLPGTATYGATRGLTWYGGYLWVVDPMAGVIRRMDPATGELMTVAGTPYALSMTPVDGVGAAARFQSPRYIVSDNSGTLFISDTNGAAIRALHVPTSRVTTFAGDGTQAYVDGLGGPTGPARIHRPRGITSDGTSIYWTEFNANTVRQGVVATLDVSTLAGTAMTVGYVEGTGPAASFDGPWSIAYHFPSRSLFVTDGTSHVLRRIR